MVRAGERASSPASDYTPVERGNPKFGLGDHSVIPWTRSGIMPLLSITLPRNGRADADDVRPSDGLLMRLEDIAVNPQRRPVVHFETGHIRDEITIDSAVFRVARMR